MSPGELRGPGAVKDKPSGLPLTTKHDFSTPFTFKPSKDLNRINKASLEMLSPQPYRRPEFAFPDLVTYGHIEAIKISDLLRNCWLFH